MDYYILAINPGSLTTKIAVYCRLNPIFTDKITHPPKEIAAFSSIISQLEYRLNLITASIKQHNFNIKLLSAVCGRGGMLPPLESGTYLINKAMVNFLSQAKRGEHASNLGAIMAYRIAQNLDIPAYTVDPVSVDEMIDIARISGIPSIRRQSLFHALNQKAIARAMAKDHNRNYNDLNLIIAHIGGGISVAAHQKGKIIDVNNGLDGDGPMSPERSGTVPLGPLYTMCFSGQYTLADIKKMNYGKGGLIAYLGTHDVREIIKRIDNGDSYAKLIYDAMIYQIAKEIGACATVLAGNVDYIVLTGGVAYEYYLVDELKKRIGFIARVLVYPGENELLSLAQGALRILNNEEKTKTFKG